MEMRGSRPSSSASSSQMNHGNYCEFHSPFLPYFVIPLVPSLPSSPAPFFLPSHASHLHGNWTGFTIYLRLTNNAIVRETFSNRSSASWSLDVESQSEVNYLMLVTISMWRFTPAVFHNSLILFYRHCLWKNKERSLFFLWNDQPSSDFKFNV